MMIIAARSMELEESAKDRRTKKLAGADLNFICFMHFINSSTKLVMGLREGPEYLEQ